MGLFDGLGALFLGAAVIDEIKTRNIKPYPLNAFENYELYCADSERLSKRELEKNVYAGKYILTDEQRAEKNKKFEQSLWDLGTVQRTERDLDFWLRHNDMNGFENDKQFLVEVTNYLKENGNEYQKESLKNFDIEDCVEAIKQGRYYLFGGN